jgi:hypothetical protein
MTDFGPVDPVVPPQPTGAMVRVHQSTADRLVLDIPPGKSAGGLGCFAIFWNGFMALFTTVFAFGQNQANDRKELLFLWLFLGLFWLVGLGLIYGWLKLRFERCFLLVERDRAVLRRMFLGRRRQTELPLDESSRAELVEAYRQNDVPVYRVSITGAGGATLHFGTALEPSEKDWCVDAVNALLQPRPATPAVQGPTKSLCEACGAVIPEDAFRSREGRAICPGCGHEQACSTSERLELAMEASPDEKPASVAILEDSPERLGLRLGVSEYAAATWFIGLFGLGFAALWYSLIGGSIWNGFRGLIGGGGGGLQVWFELAILAPFVLAGLIPVGMGLLAIFGRITTWVDREAVRIRVHVGPFGRTWTMPTANVTAVRLIDGSSLAGRNRGAGVNPRVQGSAEFSQAAGICAGSRELAMTALHRPETARFVAATVRRWLRENVPDLKC